MEIPVFPLNTVLFPGMILPLHIFEERYKIMINMCLEDQKPFGVVLIQEGEEVGEMATPHRVGTMAAIRSADHLEDNRLNIVTVGLSRFRIQEIVTTRTYPAARIADYPIRVEDKIRSEQLAARVRPAFLEYVDLLEKGANLKLKINEVPEDPETLAALIAIAMQIELRDKQTVIERATVEDMLITEFNFLSREKMILQYGIDTMDRQDQYQFGPTGQMFLN